MNKWILMVAGIFMTMQAEASSYCGYKDFFHLSSTTHPEIYVVSGYSEQSMLLQFVGPRSFILKDNKCTSGYAHVTVAYDATHWCILDIKDGPLMNHPTTYAACNQMRYISTEYDGFGTYSYSINLD